ncbi:MAG: response regulator [Rhodospirillaceae bacterium]|jgi:DNA-binding NarL/FixJ family response regulator|nr:response regulator [Rhodospirillaceae bacterium]
MATNSFLNSKSFAAESKLLLIEPDKTNRVLLTRVIEDLKPARFMAVKSTVEARQAMSERVDQFDCVIVALKNAPSSGFHYLQEIRTSQIPRTPHDTTVILVSPPLNLTMVSFAQSLDLDGFIALPITVTAMNNTLSAALKRDRELNSAEDYTLVKLPTPVPKKTATEDNKKGSKGPNARIVWTEKDKEKAELLRALKEGVGNGQGDTEAVPEEKIDNVRTFWLKDLLPGMVLAEEITGEEDELLIASGTLLHDKLIEKIKSLSELGVCRSFLKAGTSPPEP